MADSKIQNITARIWDMANQLRGTMDASEFKNYILAFMFYRYLSEHQEKFFVEEELIEPNDNETVNAAYRRITAEDGMEDYLDECRSTLGYAIEPLDTWASLTESIHIGSVMPSDFQRIFENFNKNVLVTDDSAKDFSSVFNDINLSDSRLGNSLPLRTKALSNIVSLVDDIEYKAEDGRDILGEVYENLIGKFAESAGKKGGEFYTPHAVSMILSKLVTRRVQPADEAFSVYDPTMGSGSLLLTVRDQLPNGRDQGAVMFYGQELNTTTYNLARMNLMMHDVPYNNMKINNANTLEQDWPDGPNAEGIDEPRMFDAVVANPPYSAKWDNNDNKLKDPRFKDYGKLAPAGKADFAFILHGVYHLNDTGTMAIVLPHGVLFRGAAEGKIREALINKNYLDAVIGLPANLFYGTSIPTTILVLRKDRTDRGVTDILFIDASNDFTKGKNQNLLSDEHIDKIIETYDNRVDVDKYAHVASLSEIKDNDYNLNIPRYVDTFEEEEEIDLEAVSATNRELNAEISRVEGELQEQLKLLGLTIEL